MNRAGISVLWLDDDVLPGEKMISDVVITPAQTCKEAADLLESGRLKPDFALVDLIVPQAGWKGQHVLETPGLDFMRYMRERFVDVPVAGFAWAVSPREREAALKAGATQIFDKSLTSFPEIIDRIKARVRERNA